MNLGQLSLPKITRPPQVHSRGQSPSCPTGSGNELQATARAILAWFLSGSPGLYRKPAKVCSVAKTLGRGAEVASCVCWIIRSSPACLLGPSQHGLLTQGFSFLCPVSVKACLCTPLTSVGPITLSTLGQDPMCRVTSPLGK